MYELLKDNFWFHIYVTSFMGMWSFLVAFGTVRKTKKIKNNKIKTVLRIGIGGAVICFWAYFFVYLRLYPVSLACYEYKNNLAQETIGVIDRIEIEDKDRIHLIIDNTEYTMVHSSIKPFIDIGNNIVEGDVVKIRFGEKSKYIFDISEKRKTADGSMS